MGDEETASSLIPGSIRVGEQNTAKFFFKNEKQGLTSHL
jgi:hypothetical protein